MEERQIFSEIPTIESVCCILGLRFPDTASEFQKACITLAHLYRCIGEYVMKGVDVPDYLIKLADQLNTIQYDERAKQR